MGRRSRQSHISIVLIVITCFVLSYCKPLVSHASESSANGTDIIFVIDSSFSMNTSDKDKISTEMVTLFTDISSTTNDRIGFVAFNDNITCYTPLTELTNEAGKQNLKKMLEAIECFGRTDTGLGLKKAMELLQNTDPNQKSIIVLLTDGEVDINPASVQRNAADSLHDIRVVVDQAAAKNIPIYTVGMGESKSGLAFLEDISRKTKATSYVVKGQNELSEVVMGIFSSTSNSRIVPATVTVTADGRQEFEISSVENDAAEMNIVFYSSTPIKDSQIIYPGGDINFHSDRHYSLIKISQPEKTQIKGSVKIAQQEGIKVQALVHQNLVKPTVVDVPPVPEQPAEAEKQNTGLAEAGMLALGIILLVMMYYRKKNTKTENEAGEEDRMI